MRTYYTHFDLEMRQVNAPQRCAILEAYSGASIALWWGNIERQIKGFIEDNEGSRNFNYVSKFENFLRIWRQYPLSGSINRETIEPLIAATSTLAVDGWKPSQYFGSLRDQLRVLMASEEELPRGEYEEPKAPKGGLAGRAPVSDFGPQADAPEDPENPAPAPGAPGDEAPEGDEPDNIAQGDFGSPKSAPMRRAA